MAKLNKELIAYTILTSPSLEDVSKKLNISKSTLYRLRKKDEGFQKLLEDTKRNMFQDTMNKAQAYSVESLEVLRNIMNDETATDSSRVASARTILEIGMHTCDQEVILQKIDEIERMCHQ